MTRRLALLAAFVALLACASAPEAGLPPVEALDLFDPARGRRVPVSVHRPPGRGTGARGAPCPVALVSPGYGVPHTGYSFLAEALAAAGYLAVAVGHDLPSDPPPARTGDLVADRTPLWRRGAENLRFVRDTLARRYPGCDWRRPALIGHSNGGDLSAFALRQDPGFAGALVTLDNRRFPLPRDPALRVLSLRGSDFPADPGVLPAPGERGAGTCILEIPGARHDDLQDDGPAELKDRIAALVVGFLEDGRCGL